jgi:hypothetical protein
MSDELAGHNVEYVENERNFISIFLVFSFVGMIRRNK